jgi:hypothetical protein
MVIRFRKPFSSHREHGATKFVTDAAFCTAQLPALGVVPLQRPKLAG